jgi:hypothetical protein
VENPSEPVPGPGDPGPAAPAAARARPAARPEHAAALFAGLAAFLACWVLATGELGSLGGDNAEYVLLAKALREGRGYATTWYPGGDAPHTLYPPLFPLLLVPFAGGAPASFLACHFPVAVAAGVAVACLTLLFHRRGLPPAAAALGAFAPALSVLWLRCGADILSELPFLAFVAGTLLALEPPGGGALLPRRAVAAALLATAAFYTRTAGIALLPAAGLALATRARGPWRWALPPGMAAACGAWFVRGALLGSSSGTYGGVLTSATAGGDPGLVGRVAANLAGPYFHGLPGFLLPRPGEPWGVLGTALWILALAGTAIGLRRRRLAAAPEAFAGAYLVLVAAWPFQDSRFALPLAPLLALLAVEAVAAAAARLAPLRAGAAAVAFAAILALPNAHAAATKTYPRAFRETPRHEGLPRNILRHQAARLTDTWGLDDEDFRREGPFLAAFLGALDAVRDDPDIAPGPVLATNPRIVGLLTGRTSLRPVAPGGRAPTEVTRFGTDPPAAHPEDIDAAVAKHGVRLVVRDPWNTPWATAIRAYRDWKGAHLVPVFDLQSTEVLVVWP